MSAETTVGLHKPKLYGSQFAPRLKWQCGRCMAGHDVAIVANPATKEVFVCRKCKRASVIEFTPATTEEKA